MQITDVAILFSNTDFIEEYRVIETGMDIGWNSNILGFGRLVISVSDDGKVEIDTEYMNKSFFLEVMSSLYDIAKIK